MFVGRSTGDWYSPSTQVSVHPLASDSGYENDPEAPAAMPEKKDSLLTINCPVYWILTLCLYFIYEIREFLPTDAARTKQANILKI